MPFRRWFSIPERYADFSAVPLVNSLCSALSRKQKPQAMMDKNLRHEKFGTGDGNRTHVSSLGSSRPTIERRPHNMRDVYLPGEAGNVKATESTASYFFKFDSSMKKNLSYLRLLNIMRALCGYSLMVKLQPSKLIIRVRFPLPAPFFNHLLQYSSNEGQVHYEDGTFRAGTCICGHTFRCGSASCFSVSRSGC